MPRIEPDVIRDDKEKRPTRPHAADSNLTCLFFIVDAPQCSIVALM